MLTDVINNIKKLDCYLFNKKLYKLYRSFYTNKHKIIESFYKKVTINKIKKSSFNTIDIFYYRNRKTKKILLGQLFDKYGSAKSGHHYYEDIYDLLFGLNRDKINLVLECGIGHKKPIFFPEVPVAVVAGAGLRAYRDYFFNANIIGIDIDPNVLFTEDRISTYECNQTKAESIHNFIKQAKLQDNTVDIIIDDAAAEVNAKVTLFENCYRLLSHNGVYLMENIYSTELYKYIKYFNNQNKNFQTRYISISQQEYPVFVIAITQNKCA